MTDNATKTDVLSADDRRTIETANDPQNVPASVLTEIIRRLKDKVRGCWDIAASLQERLKAGRERTEQAEADAAGLRQALEDVCKDDGGNCVLYNCDKRHNKTHADDCYVGKALSGDAGTALTERLATQERELGIAARMLKVSREHGEKQSAELVALRAVEDAASEFRRAHHEDLIGTVRNGSIDGAIEKLCKALDAADANAAGRKDGE